MIRHIFATSPAARSTSKGAHLLNQRSTVTRAADPVSLPPRHLR